MATIKDVAALAGVSVTTVSIIINGKARDRKIPDTTTIRVLDAMRKIDFHPNTNARRLRSSEQMKPTVALFWPVNGPTAMLADSLVGFQNQMLPREFDCELIFRSYRIGLLSEHEKPIINNSYNGMIIAAASQVDVDFLESIKTQTPIVLINRHSEHFSTINIDARQCAVQAADLFKNRKYRKVAVITAGQFEVEAGSITEFFLNACSKLGMSIQTSHIFSGSHSIEGGYHAAQSYLASPDVPPALFIDSDLMALGALHAFHKAGVQVPEQIEILAAGLLDMEYATYSNPSLSVIATPFSKITSAAIATMIDALTSKDFKPVHIVLAGDVILRDSFKS